MYITLYMYIISSSQYNPIMKIHIYIYMWVPLSKYGRNMGYIPTLGMVMNPKTYIYNYIPMNIPLQ